MKLYAVGGFFGSGKTTLILRLARWLCLEKRQRVVIVQNEIGRIGVDDQLLKSAGLDVTPLLGGCICCDMQTGLVSTLRRIAEEDRADAVILEASGMAAPATLSRLLHDKALPPMERWFMFLLDLARIQRLKNWFALPFVEAYFRSGGIVVANKIDAVADEFRTDFRAQARELERDVLLAEVSLASGEELPEAIRFMLDGDPEASKHSHGGPCGHDFHQAHEAGHHHEHAEHPAVCVRQRDMIVGTGFQKGVEQLLCFVARSATTAGGLVAHIKALVQDQQGRCAGCSMTRPEDAPRWSADPDMLAGPSTLTLNAIVFGIGERELASIVDAGVGALDAVKQP